MADPLTEGHVWDVLGSIADPEIPVVSLVEMGMIHAVEISGLDVRVGLRPTFAGCPALEVMKQEIGRRRQDLVEADHGPRRRSQTEGGQFGVRFGQDVIRRPRRMEHEIDRHPLRAG